MTGWMAISLSVLFAALAVAGCDRKPEIPPVSGLARVRMPIGGETFELEVADTTPTRERGLMYRPALPPGQGMIFVFDREEELGFWMKNVPFALDIVFLDGAGRIVSIRTMKPLDESTTYSNAAAQYAIELPEGTAQRLGLQPGDTLALPQQAKFNRGR